VKSPPCKFSAYATAHSHSAVSRQVNVPALLIQHLYSAFFSTCGLVWFNIRNSLDAEKAENLIKIYPFKELKKIYQ